jgi:hypothetical protein
MGTTRALTRDKMDTPSTSELHSRHPVCGERTSLPDTLLTAALARAAPGTAEAVDVQHDLRCTLQQHVTGDHYPFVLQLDGPNACSVWTYWTRGHRPATVTVLPDCPATSPHPAHDPCCEFDGHPGHHSFDIDDPFAPSGSKPPADP